MNEIDDSTLAAIRHRAEGDVRVEDLLTGARTRGIRRLRIRQAFLATGAATALAAVLAGAGAVLPGTGGGPGAQAGGSGSETATPSPWAESATPSPWAETASPQPSEPAATASASPLQRLGTIRPPVATGVKPVNAGGKIGTEPGLLHLDVADPDASELWFTSSKGAESLHVLRAGATGTSLPSYDVNLVDTEAALGNPQASSSEQVTVHGKPATLMVFGSGGARGATLRWQPADGLWAEVSMQFDSATAGDLARQKANIVQAAQWVRLDRVYRCVVDFRLPKVPHDTAFTGCGVTLSPSVGIAHTTAELSVRGAGKLVEVSTQPARAGAEVRANTQINGRAVEVHDSETSRYAYGDRVVEVVSRPGTITADETTKLLGSFQPVDNRDPNTWPTNPLR